MHHDDPSFVLPDREPPELEPLRCQLVNGHDIRIEGRLWSPWHSFEEWVTQSFPDPYFAIRIYCSENALPRRMLWTEEFREGRDFNLACIQDIWAWLNNLTQTRAIFEFDDFQQFIEFVDDGLATLGTHESDAVEHYHALPWLTAPHSFDQVDDSIFNDHNLTEPDQGGEESL